MEIIITPTLPTSELFWGLNQIKYTEVLEKLEDLYKYKMIGVTDIAIVAYEWIMMIEKQKSPEFRKIQDQTIMKRLYGTQVVVKNQPWH